MTYSDHPSGADPARSVHPSGGTPSPGSGGWQPPGPAGQPGFDPYSQPAHDPYGQPPDAPYGQGGYGQPQDPYGQGGYGQPQGPYGQPGYGTYGPGTDRDSDPTVAAGPPWPRLVASPPFKAPRLPVWPLLTGIGLAVVYVVVIIAAVASLGGGSANKTVWVADHYPALVTLKDDESAIQQDNPQGGGSVDKFLADIQKFHKDVVADQSLSAPPGNSAIYWRTMLGDYSSGSAKILQAIQTSDRSLATTAESELSAGDAAANQFYPSVGLSTQP